MSLLLKDRVKEYTTTTGTGTLTLVSAPSGFRRFSAALSNGDTTYYCIESGIQWEVGLGTYSSNTLTRDTVLTSSNSGSKINITATRSVVFVTYAADRAVYENAAGEIKVDSAIRFSDNSSQSTAFLGEVDYTGISGIPANSILGNNTGSVGDAVALNASASRTLLGLSTTDSPTFAGLTLTGGVSAAAYSSSFRYTELYPDGSTGFPIIIYKSRGTYASPTQVLTGDNLGGFTLIGRNASGWNTGPSARIYASALEDFNVNTSRGADLYFDTVSLGGLSVATRLKVGTDLTAYGNLLFGTTNSYDIGNGTYDPRSVYAATSVLTPAVSNTASQLTLTGGPDAGYFSTEGVILKTASSATAYCRAGAGILYLHQTGLNPAYIYNNPANSDLDIINQSSGGDINLTTYGSGGYVNINNATNNGVLRLNTVDNTNSALTLGNSTYGVTVPGAMGVGGAATSGKLHVKQSASAETSGLAVASVANDSYLGMYHDGSKFIIDPTYVSTGSYQPLHLRASGLDSLVLSTNRNVGVGGAATVGRFGIKQISSTYTSGLAVTSVANDSSLVIWHNGSKFIIEPTYATSGSFQDLSFRTSDTERLLISASGSSTFTGDISMSKTSAQGYIRAYSPNGSNNVSLHCDNSGDTYLDSNTNWLGIGAQGGVVFLYKSGITQTLRIYSSDPTKYSSISTASSGYTTFSCVSGFDFNSTGGRIRTFSGYLECSPLNGTMYVYTAGTNSQFDVYNSNATKYTRLTHDGTNGIVSTSAGNLRFNLGASGGYFDFLGVDATNNTVRIFNNLNSQSLNLWHNGNGQIDASAGKLILQATAAGKWIELKPNSGLVDHYTAGVNSVYRAWNAAGNGYVEITHDATTGIVSTVNTANINLVPAGGTVAVTGALTTTGDISMSKTSAQGYVYAYDTTGTKYVRMYHDGVSGLFGTSSGPLNLAPLSGLVFVYNGTAHSEMRTYATNGTTYTSVRTDGTNGIVSTSAGNLNLVPTGGTVAVTGGITATSTSTFSNVTYPLGTIKVIQASNTGVTINGTAAQWLTFQYHSDGVSKGGIGVDNSGYFAIRSAGNGYHGLYLSATTCNLFGGSDGYAIKAFTNTGFNVRNYADSADAPITCAGITASGIVTAGAYAGPAAGQIRANSAGAVSGVGMVIALNATDYTEYLHGGVVCGVRGNGSVPMILGHQAADTKVYSGGIELLLDYSASKIISNSPLDVSGNVAITGTTATPLTINTASASSAIYFNQTTTGNHYLGLQYSGATKWLFGNQYTDHSLVFYNAGAAAVVATLTQSGSLALKGSLSAGSTETITVQHDATNGKISTSSGEIILSPWGGTTSCYVSGTNSTLFVKGATAAGYIALAHNDTSYGQLAVSTGDLLFTATSSLFCFGGRTSSYPAIKRSGATIAIKLADDSGDASITAAMATFSKSVLQSAEVTGTPSGTTQTITLNDGNHQTLALTSSTGDVTVTLTVPSSSAAGTLLVVQHATTARDITWAASAGSIIWLGTEPTWNADATSSVRMVTWRYNGTNTYLTASESS